MKLKESTFLGPGRGYFHGSNDLPEIYRANLPEEI